jgi:hypothetical protein
MFNARDLFSPNRIWSIGVYVAGADFTFDLGLGPALFVLDSKTLRTANGHVHTYADPFLFVHEDDLYVFYETQAVNENGKIEALKTRDLQTLERVAEVLKPAVHDYYPFVVVNGEYNI